MMSNFVTESCLFAAICQVEDFGFSQDLPVIVPVVIGSLIQEQVQSRGVISQILARR